MSTISAGARQELVVAVAERYQTSTAAEKRRILDEFVALTGCHRKHAIRVLNGNSAQPATRRGRRCVCTTLISLMHYNTCNLMATRRGRRCVCTTRP